jgi:hypothetical protein
MEQEYMNHKDLGLQDANTREQSNETGGTRAEHLAWCKRRALEYCDIGDVNQAFASMGSDLGKHPKTENHPAIQLGMMMLMSGHLSTPEKMRKFIEGFN